MILLPNKKSKGKFVYLNESGKAVGIGEEMEIITPTKTPGFEIIQSVYSGSGSMTGDKLPVDEEIFKEVNDPKKDIWLKDLEVRGSDVSKKSTDKQKQGR